MAFLSFEVYLAKGTQWLGPLYGLSLNKKAFQIKILVTVFASSSFVVFWAHLFGKARKIYYFILNQSKFWKVFNSQGLVTGCKPLSKYHQFLMLIFLPLETCLKVHLAPQRAVRLKGAPET